MELTKTRLGKTELMVTRTSFGALPIQRLSIEDAAALLRKAYDAGINFFDTARSYSDSEEKIGVALSDVREDIYIATKSPSLTRKGVLDDIDTSLLKMKTDHVDILQLHNPACLPDPEDAESSYAGLIQAKREGKTRFIGITQHNLANAIKAVKSGLYDTMQFPLSSLSSDEDLQLIDLCREYDVGLIAMKGMSGGLIRNPATTFSFLRQYENVVPIWGVQKAAELDDFLRFEKEPPTLDEDMWQRIKDDREQLKGSFCRACGYCMPCPAGIQINTCARMSLLLRRAPYQNFITDAMQAEMAKIDDCRNCGACKSRCPYHLDTPALLRANYEDYKQFIAALDK